jgi:hypothetical protein
MGKPSLAERAKLPMKSIKYPFFGLLPSANVLMLSLSRVSNVTFPQVASTPSGKPRRGGSLFIWAVSPILVEFRRMASTASFGPKNAGSW